jgi:hypothetical protein
VVSLLYLQQCLAGESAHFFDEVHELSKISENDCVRRIYMARHIIEKYIVAGWYFLLEIASFIHPLPCFPP